MNAIFEILILESDDRSPAWSRADGRRRFGTVAPEQSGAWQQKL